MSKDCGKLTLKEATDPKTGEVKSALMGSISLATFAGFVCLVPNEKRTANSPDFRLKVKTRDGWRDMGGGAWAKDSEKVRGGRFMTITLDDDHMPRPVYVTAFPADEQPGDKGEKKSAPVTVFDVVWSRAKSPSQAAAPLVPADGAPDLDDEIPF